MKFTFRSYPTLATALASILLIAISMGCRSTVDTGSAAERQARKESSPQWQGGKFVNALERKDNVTLSTMWAFFTGGSQAEFREPTDALPVLTRSAADFQTAPASGLRVTWLGHSSILLEIDGARILFDPVWGQRTSPVSFAGPKRFHKPPLSMKELLTLDIDAIIISHNHYDHLDEPTIRAIKDMDTRFVMPLGVGAYFEEWGVPKERIVELDWWEAVSLGDVSITATPARHFSGRSMTFSDQDETLWASYAVVGPRRRAYFSGDTAMFPGFKEIGKRLGPFDLTMLEVGAYNPAWTDVHLGPEQAVQAHKDLRGKVFLPIHWGTFDLALHGWTEPMERSLKAAREAGVPLLAPRPGQSMDPINVPTLVRWWPEQPFQTADETPVVSTGLKEDVTLK